MRKKYCPVEKRNIHSLTLLLAFIVFIVISITMFLTGFTIIILSKLDILIKLPTPNKFTGILFIAILSIIIATVLTLLLGHIPLKPLNQLIDATNELSKGNFHVRIHFNSPNELKKLSDSFNKMAEELGSIEVLRNDFVNNFSHEFKTPIVSLKGFAKLLKNDDLPKEERDEYLDIIVSESSRLASLATNVLNLSKVENQKIANDKENFDLTESIRRSILLLERSWKNKKLNLHIDLDEVTFYGNEELLNQVWVNLIDNAIKFTPNTGKIEIILSKINDRVYFKIADSGCGMALTTQNHIFDKFYQGDTSHNTPGNGLGLSLVKNILNLYNGTIKVTSSVNQGSIFTVILKEEYVL